MGSNSTKDTYQVTYFDYDLGVPIIDINITFVRLNEYIPRIDSGAIVVLNINKDRIYS